MRPLESRPRVSSAARRSPTFILRTASAERREAEAEASSSSEAFAAFFGAISLRGRQRGTRSYSLWPWRGGQARRKEGRERSECCGEFLSPLFVSRRGFLQTNCVSFHSLFFFSQLKPSKNQKNTLPSLASTLPFTMRFSVKVGINVLSVSGERERRERETERGEV